MLRSVTTDLFRVKQKRMGKRERNKENAPHDDCSCKDILVVIRFARKVPAMIAWCCGRWRRVVRLPDVSHSKRIIDSARIINRRRYGG